MKQAHILQVSWVQWKLTNTLSNTRESASLLLFHLMALLWWEKWKEECNKRQKMVALDYRSVGNWLSAHTHTHWHTGTRAVRRPPLPGTVCTNDRMVESLPSCQYSSVGAARWPDLFVCVCSSSSSSFSSSSPSSPLSTISSASLHSSMIGHCAELHWLNCKTKAHTQADKQ